MREECPSIVKKIPFNVFFQNIIIHTNTLFLKGYYLNKSKLDFHLALVVISKVHNTINQSIQRK